MILILGLLFGATLLAAAVTTWVAIARAPEGHEDESGFHLDAPEGAVAPGRRVAAGTRARVEKMRGAPEGAAAEPVAPAVPAGLLGAR